MTEFPTYRDRMTHWERYKWALDNKPDTAFPRGIAFRTGGSRVENEEFHYLFNEVPLDAIGAPRYISRPVDFQI